MTATTAPAAPAPAPVAAGAASGGSYASAVSPNTAAAPAPPQCLFDRVTGVGIQAYDILSMPSLTNLGAWARMEWRDCSTGTVKVSGVGGGRGGLQLLSGACVELRRS